MVEDFAEDLARMAVELHEESGVEQTLQRVVDFALDALGCKYAGVLLVQDGKIVETAGTDPIVEKAGQLQLECGEGPCVSAIFDSDSVIIPDTLGDKRYPAWAPMVAELGLRSVLAVRLATSEDRIGSLNMFDPSTDRFDRDDDAVAHVLAQHASVALASTRTEAELWQAADARKLIGQAQGILMERFGLDPDEAFAVLRRYSQDNNVKLREVAERLVETRRLPAG